MKNIKIIFIALMPIVLGSSCSSDDDSPTEPTENEMASGTYQLVELGITPEQDIDGDGTSTSNALSELTCATGTLTLNADASFEWAFTSLAVTSITGGLFNIACTSNTITLSGTWQVQGNTLTLFEGVETTNFSINGDTLTNNSGGELPEFSAVVYEKQ